MLIAKLSKDRFDHLMKLKREVNEAQKRLQNFQQDCRVEAPVQRGDKTKIDGYSYRSQKMEITGINIHFDFSGQLYWKAHGQVLKKNGEPGQQRADTIWKVVSE